jgi:hypothetical protein
MKKLLLFLVFLLAFSPSAFAAMESFQTFSGDGMAVSVDAVAMTDQSTATVSAEIPADATVVAAYLYSASVWSSSLYNVSFGGTLLTSDASSKLDVATKEANDAAENRWDVTSIVQTAYDGLGGVYDFDVTEHGYLDGEILAVVYSVDGADTQTVLLFDGELATTGDSFDVVLPEGYDGTSDAIMSLGISYSYQYDSAEYSQYSVVDINGERLTSSAGGNDDGNGVEENGMLITAGGFGDNPANPADPNAYPENYTSDDELYNLAPFLSEGDTLITISTLNPSNDDNIFFMALTVNGEAYVDDGNNSVPEPATMILLGTGLIGVATMGRKRKR